MPIQTILIPGIGLPAARFLRTEVARLARFLLSDASSRSIGETINVDGGVRLT